VTKSRVERAAGAATNLVLGTGGLLAAVSEVTRDIIEPHLGAQEVAVTSAFEVQHRAPLPMGTEAELVVTVAQVAPMRMLCDFVVRHNGTVAARGAHEQTVLELDEWRHRLDGIS
jgi:predicted thioesterase